PRSKTAAKNSTLTNAAPVEANEVYSNRIERNQVGIALTEGANNNTIGSKSTLTAGLGNTIRGNTDGAGVGLFIGVTDFIESDPESRLPSGNKIVGNHIGENSDGELSSNRIGLVISQAQNNLVGMMPSTGTSLGNTIVGSQEVGVRVADFKTKGNQIAFNYV